MQSQAATVPQYLASLPADRRAAIEAVRAVILDNLDRQGFEEGMQYGMIGYYVPHRIYPAGYHCNPGQPLPYAGIASQKQYMSIYLMAIYSEPQHEQWLRAAWAKTGKKLDMGKSCIRFKRIEDIPLAVIGEAIRRVPAKAYIARYETILGSTSKGARALKKSADEAATTKAAELSAKKTATKTTTAKKTATKKTTTKAPPTKKTTTKKTTPKAPTTKKTTKRA